jgi:Flp pilus assembly protein TadB
MTIEIILLLLLVIVCALLVVMVMLGVIPMGRGRGDSQFRNLFDSQRAGDDYGDLGKAEEDEAFKAAKAASSKKASDSAITIEKKLKWAQWSMNVTLFHSIEAGLSFISFLLGTLLFGPLVLLACLSVGPITMRALLNRAVENRFLSFDKDYPSFLLSLVGLLKTGMNPMSAIEAASKGMEEHSLVKQEVDVMLERLRYGVPEDQSIGSFAEDIYHPEVELFVQALLLSRAVGGTLSDTLDRLARQVRKRQ